MLLRIALTPSGTEMLLDAWQLLLDPDEPGERRRAALRLMRHASLHEQHTAAHGALHEASAAATR